MRDEWLMQRLKYPLVLLILLGSAQINAELPSGIIGGRDLIPPTTPYVAFVSLNGTLTKLSGSGLPISGAINSVAINDAGACLIGGVGPQAGTSFTIYAALVSANGTLTKLLGAGIPGEIRSVAINHAGAGLIGGEYSTVSAAYAAFVAPDGTTTQLSGAGLPTFGRIISVAINDAGTGLIGGQDSTAAYAALVAPNGTLTQLSGSGFPTSGTINSVAINDAGTGLIGGVDSTAAYAALVAPNGTLTQLSGSGFPTSGAINSVAINDAGTGLIGGQDIVASVGFAALVAPNGTLTQLSGSGLLKNSVIVDVAINNSGVGLIGGADENSLIYAALVSPNGTVTRLSESGFLTFGGIESVAINDAGVGLIGGNDTSLPDIVTGYAALVSPNGTLTRLSGSSFPPAEAEINSVAISDTATPKSIGPYSSVIHTQLAASNTLTTRLMMLRHQTSEAAKELAAADPIHSQDTLSPSDSNETLLTPQFIGCKKPPIHSFWMAPFGDFVHLKAQGKIPSFTNEIGGVVTAYDQRVNTNLLFGGGASYAFNYVHYSDGLGHGKIHEEMIFLYTSYQQKNFRFNAAVWSGLYQLQNERHVINLITSKAHTHGWILDPHIEMALPYAINKSYCIEPFVLCDFVNSWQRHFTESGKSGFNLVIHNLYASLVQSELGLRIYEEWKNEKSSWLFEEKLSYVNQVPIHFHSVNTFFIESISVFPIVTGGSKIQNLGCVQLCGSFLPCNWAYPFVGIDFQAMLGTSYQSYYAGLHIGKNF